MRKLSLQMGCDSAGLWASQDSHSFAPLTPGPCTRGWVGSAGRPSWAGPSQCHVHLPCSVPGLQYSGARWADRAHGDHGGRALRRPPQRLWPPAPGRHLRDRDPVLPTPCALHRTRQPSREVSLLPDTSPRGLPLFNSGGSRTAKETKSHTKPGFPSISHLIIKCPIYR